MIFHCLFGCLLFFVVVFLCHSQLFHIQRFDAWVLLCLALTELVSTVALSCHPFLLDHFHASITLKTGRFARTMFQHDFLFCVVVREIVNLQTVSVTLNHFQGYWRACLKVIYLVILSDSSLGLFLCFILI